MRLCKFRMRGEYDVSETFFGGYEIGSLVMKSWVPKPPGHISCASSFDFPVYYYPIDHTSNKSVHSGDQSIIPYILEAVGELEKIGCKAVVSSCGYFGHYQKVVSEKAGIPVYLSAVCLIPFVFRLLGKNRKLAVICYNKEKFTSELFRACGVSEEQQARCYLYDVIGQPELGKIVTDCGGYNISEAQKEVVSVSLNAIMEHEDIGAFLLECTDLPPYAAAIQAAINLPVFDATSMVKFVHNVVAGSHKRILLLTVAGQAKRFSKSLGGG